MSSWERSWRADPRARPLADRHYNRQSVGAPQFVPPGRCLVLLTPEAGALWVTSWPYAQFTKHHWAGAWMNSLFRLERRDLYLASDLIREAVAITRGFYGAAPAQGMVSFVDEREVKAKQNPGYCYIMAGFKLVGRTKDENLLAFQMLPEDMPEPIVLDQHSLWAVA